MLITTTSAVRKSKLRWYRSNRDKVAKYHAKRRALIDQIKDVPCADCGGRFPPFVMDFDHREGEVKRLNIGRQKHSNLALVLEEIEKCDIVCANCHRIRTKERGYNGPQFDE